MDRGLTGRIYSYDIYQLAKIDQPGNLTQDERLTEAGKLRNNDGNFEWGADHLKVPWLNIADFGILLQAHSF